MRFNDKICLVTGAGSGIGHATALQFAAEGGRVVVADFSEPGGQETADLITQAGGIAIFSKTDVGIEAEVKSSVDMAIRKWGRIDVVINDAAVMTFDRLVDLPTEKWDQIMNINLRTVLAAAVCFRASSEASYINGTTLVADGGRLNIL